MKLIKNLKPKTKPKISVLIAGIKWNLFVTRNMSFWHHVITDYGHYHYARAWGMEAPLQFMHLTVHGTQTYVFKNKENARVFDINVLETFSTGQQIAKIKRFYQIFAAKLFNKLHQCLNELSAKNWADFIEAYACFSYGLAITTAMGRIGTEELIKKLQELGFKESKIQSIISVVTYPKHHTPLFNSSLDLLKIGKQIQSGKLKKEVVRKELENWLDKHGYIPVNFVDEPWTLENAEEQLKSLLQKDCQKEFAALNVNHTGRFLASQKLLKKINSKQISLLAYALQEATYLNEFRKNVFSKVSLNMRPLFAAIAKKAVLESWRDCYYLTPDEIFDILKGKNISPRKIIKKRDIAGMYIARSGELTFLNDGQTKKVYNFVQSPQVKSRTVKGKKIIKGFSANSGYVKAVVKIVLNAKDFPKLRSGEILVTTMTSVDFVPVMEKAAAFITNEGGITSHAAIIAREMDKPCIVGTKIATQVLKDGDRVEVDADNGIVKISAPQKHSPLGTAVLNVEI